MREASRLSEPRLLRHCLPRKLAAPRQTQPGLRTPKLWPGRQASGVPYRVPDILGLRPERGTRSVPRQRGEMGREAEEEKVCCR